MLDPDDIEARCEALVGEVLGGRYRLDAVLGIGAMGAVFRGFHTGLRRDVAIKLLHRDLMKSEEMRTRFSREAAAISKLDHPNCVRVSDFGSDDEYQYLVMELLQGAPLSAELEQPLAPLRALTLIDEVLAGLEHAHGHGLIHRDIKPDNIFLAEEVTGESRAKLLDFGIVKLQEQQGERQLTQVGMVFGTPHFMSPEQAMGSDVDARTDLYAVGILLYLMLAGSLPFDSDDPVKVLRQQIQDAPPPLPSEVPRELVALVERLLAKKPEERFASATAVREALAEVREAMEPKPEPTPEPAPEPVLEDAASAEPADSHKPSLPPPPGRRKPATPAPELPVEEAPKPAVAPIAPGPAAQSPALVVPSRSSIPNSWIAGGIGALVLLVVIIVSAGGDEPEDPPKDDTKAQAAEAAKGFEALLGGDGDEPEEQDDGDDEVVVEDEDDVVETTEDRTLQASLRGIDNAIGAGKFDSARMLLEPLIETHPEDAQLHLRMARVLVGLGGVANRTQALGSYSKAIGADRGLLEDEAFMTELMALIDDGRLREAAIAVAIDHLGSKADDTLLSWINVQAKPLRYPTRHRIIGHLEGHDRGAQVNRPLQAALDLWQAGQADDACAAFDEALDHALESPDSFLLGTLRKVPVPKTAEDQGGQPCGSEPKLEQARSKHEQMFAGIDPVVPRAYRKRRKNR